jgi:hypothetical protein
MTTTTKTATRKPQPRSLHFYPGAPALLTLTVGKKSDDYWVHVIPADWGAGFELKNVDREGHYHVLVSSDGKADSCDCMGFEHHRHCKHFSSIKKLIDLGKLPAPPAMPEPLETDFLSEFLAETI